MEWQPIYTKHNDGRSFQAWVERTDEPDTEGWWEPMCRFDEYGKFQIWDRADYDCYDWKHYDYLKPTHWMPIPGNPEEKTEFFS